MTTLLTDLFSRAHIELSVPRYRGDAPSTSASGPSRDVAFYDEVLYPRLQLHLPSLPSFLPPPQRGYATYPLPVSLDEADDADLEERSEQARSTRMVLLALLVNIAIELRGSYVAPRAPLPPGSAPLIPPTIAATPSTSSGVPTGHGQKPAPTMSSRRDAPYQSIEAQYAGDEVGFFTTLWQGNKPPTRKKRPATSKFKKRVSRNSDMDDETEETLQSTSFAMWDQKEQRWTIEWEPEVSVSYARHRHPNPALLLNASLSLRLSPTSALMTALESTLAGGSPYLDLLALQREGPDEGDDDHNGPASSWADHDLLASLSSGPVYPDESPSQRAARAASALAKLPLTRLPTKVLGTRLITPERSAQDVGNRVTSRTTRRASQIRSTSRSSANIDDDDGSESDLTDLGSSGRSVSSSSSRSSSLSSAASSRSGSHAGPKVPSLDTSMNGATDFDSEAIVTLHRSVRRAMDVRSAVGVRMRTTVLEEMDLGLLQTSQNDDFSESRGRALLLCVEVENPSDSGLIFDVRSCDVDIVSSAIDSDEQNGMQAEAVLFDDGQGQDMQKPHRLRSSSRPFQLQQGEQRNLVYFVRFSLAPGAKLPTYDVKPNRAVAIVVHGKPLLLDDGQDYEDRLLTSEFSSTWNCTLDMSSLQEDVRRRTLATMPAQEIASALPTQRNAVAAAVVSGSSKHTPSALALAAQHDGQLLRDREHAAMLAPSTSSSRPNMERSASGLASAPFAGRFLPSSIGARAPSSVVNTDMTGPDVSTGSSGARWPSGSSMRSSSTTANDQVLPSSLSGSGVGLLAQARLRAASTRTESDASPLSAPNGRSPSKEMARTASQRISYPDNTEEQRNRSTSLLSRNGVRISLNNRPGGSPRDSVRLASIASNDSSATADTTSTIPAGPGGQGRVLSIASTTTPVMIRPNHGSFNERLLRPVTLEKGPLWLDNAPGFAITAIVQSLVSSDEEQEHSIYKALRPMQVFVVEFHITNRTDGTWPTFVFSWARLAADNTYDNSDDVSWQSDEEAGFEPENGQRPLSHGGRPNLLSATGALAVHRRSTKDIFHHSAGALLPLDNHVRVDRPLPPGETASVTMPVRALRAGVWDVGEVLLSVLSDVDGQVTTVRLRGIGSVVVAENDRSRGEH